MGDIPERVEQAEGVCEFAMFRPAQPLEQQMAGCLRAVLGAALSRASGNKCAAALALGVHRNTLQRHLDRLGMDARSFRPLRKRVARADVREVMRATCGAANVFGSGRA